jgi:cell division septum initiation protein DivIVA
MDDGVHNDVTGTPQPGTTATQFVEYQRLVQTIREQVNTENSALKAENDSLKTELAILRTREATLVKDNELLQGKSEDDIKRLETQVKELQAFKTKIQSACGAG